MSKNGKIGTFGKKIVCYFDGAITINPGGRMSCGHVVKEPGLPDYEQNDVFSYKQRTCNVAEWVGLHKLLLTLYKKGYCNKVITIYGDSNIVVNGILGIWRAKKPHLKELKVACGNVLSNIKGRGNVVGIEWVPRELNKAHEVAGYRQTLYSEPTYSVSTEIDQEFAFMANI